MLAIIRDLFFHPQRKLRIKLCTFNIDNLENNQTNAINHIEAKSTEFATTTRLAKDNCWASQYNSGEDNIVFDFKSIPIKNPKYRIGSPL